ncbi:phage tail tape measure protein [Agrococcus sp. SL85]|uniref:phage tail tape measure protein n=1 Tax=Agrococcus sp. SL85 TaxID=2995141 RepID=UPI00226CED30|nr:phage tail tape measure protein [Agrococcus sp. SL85]WAC65186.1 phage tail tape measure protein [Agrococcus sp. SL85]
MANGVELATAWVRLVPSMEGVQEQIVGQFAPAERAAEESGRRAGGRFSSAASLAIGGAAIGAGLVAGFRGLYEVGSIFDDVSDTIRVGTGAVGEDLAALEQSARNVGTTVPAEFSAVGQTVADLNTRMGLTGEELETVASQYLEAGRILGQDIDIASTSAAFNAFGVEQDGVSDAMDRFFQVSQATGVGMNELASGVQANAPALQALGFSLDDSVSLLGALDKGGLNANQVMSSLSRGLVNLARDGEEPAEAFQRVTGELQGFVDEGNTAAAIDLASQVFGTRGASQFVGALQSGVLNLEDLQASVGSTADTILGAGEETQDFAETWQLVQNQALAALEPLASQVFAAMGEGLVFLMPYLEGFAAWLGENPDLLTALAIGLGVVAVALGVAAIAQWAMNSAMLASPLTWIILAVVALIAAIVLLALNWDTVVAWISEVWGGFVGWLTEVVNGFVAWWNSVWGAVGAFFTGLWDGLVAWVIEVWGGFIGWLQDVGNGLAEWWNGLWSGIGDFFAGVWDGIVAAARGAINTVIDLVNGIINAINDVAGVIGGAFGVDFTIPNVPRLAQGATIKPRRGGTLAVLAEAGRPETVVDTGLVNRALAEGLDGENGGKSTDADLAERIADILWQRERTTARTLGQVARGYTDDAMTGVVRR